MVKKNSSQKKIDRAEKQKATLLAVLTVVLILIDQITKYTLPKIDFDIGFFALSNITNTGVSFGLFKGTSLIIIIISIIFIGLIYFYKKEFKNKEIYAALIISGIIGNLVDRILLGHVIDFLDFKWFPVFNFADTWIFLGVFGYIIHKVIDEIKHNKKSIHKNKNSKKTKS